jgi:flagellar biogenesis protein FliO
MEIVRQSLAVVLVFGLLWIARRLLRQKTLRTTSASAVLESRGKLALTPRHSIHLIRIGDRNLIIALHPEGVTFLGDGESLAEGGPREAASIGSGAI